MTGIRLASMIADKLALNLDGEILIIGFEFEPAVGFAGVRVNTDGTIDKLENTTYTQIDAASDWVIPNDKATSAFEFRCTDNAGTLAAGSDSTGVWLPISVNREWWVEGPTLPAVALDITLEVRYNGGPVQSSGGYAGSARSSP